MVTFYNPDPAPVIPAAAIFKTAGFFRVTLTGVPDGLTDVVLPVSRITARMRSGSPSYLQVVVPYTIIYATQIADRPNGDIKLDQISLNSANVETVTTVLTTAFETVQTSIGITNRSINLTGHRQSTNSAPTNHTVTALSIQTSGTSKNTIVPGYDPLILPGDTITAEGVTYVLGTVVLQASVGNSLINIQTQLIEV